MKVLFDHTIFTNQKYGGISRYYTELMNQFYAFDTMECSLSVLLSNNYYLQNSKHIYTVKFFPNRYFKGRDKAIIEINTFYTKYRLKEKKYDLFHPTYYDVFFLEFIGDKPFVLTVHDLIHEKFKELFQENDKTAFYKRKLIEKASIIIAISENTKQDIIDVFNIDPKKIVVIYHGNSMKKYNGESISLKTPQEYILFVGSRGDYKNFTLFIKAFSLLYKENKNISIVCAGGKAFSYEELEFFKELKIEDNVYQFTVNDSELAYLYSRAIFFVFPSLYEGFGIPVLEAFASECPLVCSNTSSLPEIAQDGAEYFNPYSKEDIYTSMKKIYKNPKRRELLVSNGLKRLESFSWEKTARQTLKVYRDIVDDKKINDIPKVSIVTVVYNDKEALEKTMLSVLEQDYSNIEYIVIDGGSSDGTVDIIKKYEDRITYWVSEKDNGIYDAMNKGISVATGSFINFMNAGDNFYSNDILTNIANKIELHDNDIIYGNVVYERKDGTLFIDDKSRKKQANIYEINHQSCFYNLDLHEKYGVYSMKYPISADFLFLNSAITKSAETPLKIDVSVVKYDESGFSRVNIIKHQIEKIKISIELYGLTLYIITPSITIVKVLIKKILGRKN